MTHKEKVILITIIVITLIGIITPTTAGLFGPDRHSGDYFSVEIPENFTPGTNSGPGPTFSGSFIYFWSDNSHEDVGADITVSIDNNSETKNEVINNLNPEINGYNIIIDNHTNQGNVEIYQTHTDSTSQKDSYKVYGFFTKDGVNYYISVDYDTGYTNDDNFVAVHDAAHYQQEINWIMGLYNSLEKK